MLITHSIARDTNDAQTNCLTRAASTVRRQLNAITPQVVTWMLGSHEKRPADGDHAVG